MPTRYSRTRIDGEDYVLVPAKDLRAIMEQATMTVRLVTLLLTRNESVLVDALLPVLREGVPKLCRALVSPRERDGSLPLEGADDE